MLMCALFLPIAHETAGAARIRHSLRPLFGEGERFFPQLGRSAPRERKSISAVIASEAKQSMSRHNDRWIASSQKLPCANALRLSQAMRLRCLTTRSEDRAKPASLRASLQYPP